jgi:choline-sulfatase
MMKTTHSVRSWQFLGTIIVLAILTTAPLRTAWGGDRPNVLLIITDQQSADVMSCRMGNQYLNTPAMDSLAAGGMLFTRAYSSNPLCMPLRNSLFTGRYPHETGVTKNAPQGGSLGPEFVNMGTYFRDAGYKTAYSGKWHMCFNEKDPGTHGFEILDAKTKLTPPEIDNYDSRVSHAAVEFLERNQDKPFLLVVSLLNPHNICEWARRAAGREQKLSCGEIGTPPSSDQLPPPPANLAPPTNEPDGMTLIRRAYQVDDGLFPVGKFTPEDWRKQRWGYYRMVEKVDGEIAKVLDALREAGAEENTLVVFTADHGDCTGAHRFNQKTVFYEESVRVPLIVRWKGKTAAGTSDELVNTGVDILPTMLACAGIEQPKQLPGRSVLPLALGQPVGPWRDYLVSENNMSQTGQVDGLTPTMEGRMVRTARYKYGIYSNGTRRESLIDLEIDPGETNDLAADPKYRDVILKHRELLAQFGKEHNDALVAQLLADDVKPLPFTDDAPQKPKRKRGKAEL